MWNLLQFILVFFINLIFIFPICVFSKAIFKTPKIDSFFTTILSFFSIPINENHIYIAELSILILSICCLWAFIFPHFPITRFFQRIFYGQCKPTPIEQEKLNLILEYIETYSHLDTKRYQFFIKQESNINAFASGTRDVTITQGMLVRFDVAEIAGIIAHEIGHHVHGDVKFMNMTSGLMFLTTCCSKILQLAIFLLNLLRFIPILCFFSIPLVFILVAFSYIYVYFIDYPARFLYLLFNRQIEFKADRYALQVGLDTELLAGLQGIYLCYGNDPWWKTPLLTHPRTLIRIGRLKKKLEQSTKSPCNRGYSLDVQNPLLINTIYPSHDEQ